METGMIGATWPIAFMLAVGAVAPITVGAVPVATPPPTFGMMGEAPVLTAHGEGVQLYECKANAGGVAAWTFREPVATLIADGKTVGRHFAGPTWELDDGGAVKAKLVSSLPGAAAGDIPLLNLSVTDNRGVGALKGVAVVLRLKTHGGVLKGGCDTVGALKAVTYSAEYSFWR
jgi:hypothetical protein